MPCLCDLATSESIAELRAACTREFVGGVEAVRLRAPIETYADAFSRELRVSADGVGIDSQIQPSEQEVRDAFEKGTETLWKVLEKKFLSRGPPSAILLPESLDGIKLFRTISLSSGIAKEESIAVVEDCRSWAMWSKHIAMGNESALYHMMVRFTSLSSLSRKTNN